MIDVSHARAAVAAAPGDRLALMKEQLLELIAEVEAGQEAQRTLTCLRAGLMPHPVTMPRCARLAA